MTGRLSGKNAIVTGAASGIGRATAHRLSGDGASLLCVDRDEAGLADVVASLSGSHAALAADLSLAPACATVVETALEIWEGRIDILVNAAAVLIRQPILEHSRETWDLTIDINLKAPFRLARDVVASMIEGSIRGAVVNVGSIEAVLPIAGHAAYTASKGAVTMLTRSAAYETAPYGIRVNAVAPGATATGMNADLRENDPDRWREMLAGTPMGRHAQPEEIASVIAFLASDEASYVTGAVVTADGGWTLH